MTTPYPAPPLQLDIEAVLVPWIKASLAAQFSVTARVLTETPENLADVVPVVAVSRSGGTDLLAIIDRPVVDVDCFAATRLASNLLARQVHNLLHGYLPGTVAGGAVIGQVSTVKAPGWLPYQDLDIRRCNATYEIYAHPAPA